MGKERIIFWATIVGAFVGLWIASSVDFGLHLEMYAWFLIPMMLLQFGGITALGAISFRFIAKKYLNSRM